MFVGDCATAAALLEPCRATPEFCGEYDTPECLALWVFCFPWLAMLLLFPRVRCCGEVWGRGRGGLFADFPPDTRW